MCTWLNRSTVPACAFSIIAPSGPRKYPKPPCLVGSTPFSRMSRICSCVGKPGSVSLDMSTSLPSAASHICAIFRPMARNRSLYLRESGVFQPKCHTEVWGPVSSFWGGC